MKRALRTLVGKMNGFRFRRGIGDSLALNRRGEARSDGLTLIRVINHVAIEWYARGIHPWDRDRDISPEDRSLMFVQQCLSDTEAAILRIFERFPHVDSIDVRVLEPQSKRPIIAGTVFEASLETNDNLSVGMRLMLSGLTFRLSGWAFDALDLADEHNEHPYSTPSGMLEPADAYK
jgi:hypothetical protein